MAGGRNLTVYLTSDVSKFTKGLKQGQSSMRKFGKTIAVGAAAAGAALVAVGVDAVQAAMAQEKANVRLGKTLDNLNLGEHTDDMLDMIGAMQAQYGVNEDDLIPAFERLVRVTGNTTDATNLLMASMDTAAGTGLALETVSSGIAKAMDGNAGALKRIVPGLDTSSLKAGDAAAAFKLLNKQFGGQAQANADTTAGSLERIALAAGEVEESLGKGLLEGFVGPDADAAVHNLEKSADEAERVGVFFGNLGSNALGWASDFILGLEAISYYTDTWALDMTSKINGVLDALNLISDEEGQRRSDVERRMQAERDWQAREVVNGPSGATGGGTFASTLTPGFGTSDLYRSGPRSVDPNRYKARADDADARATARGTKTRANP